MRRALDQHIAHSKCFSWCLLCSDIITLEFVSHVKFPNTCGSMSRFYQVYLPHFPSPMEILKFSIILIINLNSQNLLSRTSLLILVLGSSFCIQQSLVAFSLCWGHVSLPQRKHKLRVRMIQLFSQTPGVEGSMGRCGSIDRGHNER